MKIDHLTINQTTAIQPLAHCEEINTDLQVLDIKHLSGCTDQLAAAIKSGGITEQSSFINVFGPNKNFYYCLEQFNNGVKSYYERGIAQVYTKNDKVYFKRICVLYYMFGANQIIQNATGQPQSIKCNHTPCNTYAYSCIPPTYYECLAPENAVLTSSDSFVPNPIPVKQNSFLLRFDEQIENVDLDDKRLIPYIVKLISNFTKQLKLSTSKLTTKRTETELLDLKPTVNPKPKVGSIYYDKDNDQVKVYTSNGWRTLSYLEDN